MVKHKQNLVRLDHLVLGTHHFRTLILLVHHMVGKELEEEEHIKIKKK